MANMFGTRHDIDNRARTSKTTGVPYTVSKLHELWPTGGLKWKRHFYPPSVNASFPGFASRI